MNRRDLVPVWVIAGLAVALGANLLASTTTRITIGLMRSHTPFAVAVREHDLMILPYYRAAMFAICTALIVAYIWPVARHCRAALDGGSALVRRRTVNAPLVIAAIGFTPWLLSAIFFPLVTIVHFGRWSPELSSQQVFSSLVNGFLAATTTYLLLDWLFRAAVVPSVFPHGRLAEVEGSLALGVRARLLVFLIAVAFVPLFTVLGLIRAASARVASGASLGDVLPMLSQASQVTFGIYVALGIGFTLLLARTFTQPLAAAAEALRRIQRGDLATRVQTASSDEVGVLEDGVNDMAAALQDRERILKTFGRVVEPAVRDHLLAGELRLGGEVRPATVLFCDLRGFTTAAEQMAPADVVATLNQFFSAMAVWVRECGGFVDKFVGDAMLVVFGLFGDRSSAPAAADAIRCALGMPERLAALNVARAAAEQWPLVISIGIDSGAVLAGTIGAEDRLEYTVIGDTVNVANRLQQLCKERGRNLLVSEATVELARAAGSDPPLAAIDTVPLRGRRGAVRVYGTPD